MYRPVVSAGIDEVGRGPLAGAVYAAAVVLDPFVEIPGLKDSKKLSEKKRQMLDRQVREHALAFAVARAEVEEIDRINILQASMLAMQRAYAGLGIAVDYALVDGNRVPELPCRAEPLIKGDSKCEAIMAASILAKVARDEEMKRLDRLYPEYGLAGHKGYPTPSHLEAIRLLGPSPVHRLSFGPCKESQEIQAAGEPVARQTELVTLEAE